MMEHERLKLFYTKQNGENIHGVAVRNDGSCLVCKMTPERAIEFASDLLDQAISAKKVLERSK